MRKIKPVIFLLAVLLGAIVPAAAQQRGSKEPSWAEIQQQMHDMQKQMLEELQRSPFFRGDWITPDSTGSSFFFRLDTTFNNDPHQFLRELFGDEFERDFFGFDAPRRGHAMPPDDGAWRERGGRDDGGEGELLPEERLRKQPEPRTPGKNNGDAKSGNGQLKTIRI